MCKSKDMLHKQFLPCWMNWGQIPCDAKRPPQAQEQSTHYHGEGLSGDLPVDDSLTHLPASQAEILSCLMDVTQIRCVAGLDATGNRIRTLS